MENNSTQAVGVALFLIAFTLISAGMLKGGSLLLILPGLVLLGIGGAVLRRAKSLEHEEN